MTRRRVFISGVVIAPFLIAGCASPTRAPGTFYQKPEQWQGRLALKVSSAPPQAFSANFELRGNAQAGALTLSTIIGSTLARMQWSPSGATLLTTGAPRQFSSLAALVLAATGIELPVENLFSWLAGENFPANGWEADLSALDQGRLLAKRPSSAGDTELKIILDP